METDDYYNRQKGCERTFLIILALIILTAASLSAQSWQYENLGLRPNSLQATYNFRNTATGLRYGRLFQNVPFGLYGGFSQTISADQRYNTYPWERRFTLGGSLTVPNQHPLIHLMFTFGGAYNWHEDTGKAGQFDSHVSHTSNYGVDLGIQAQIKRILIGYDVGLLSDYLYCQMRIGYCFK